MHVDETELKAWVGRTETAADTVGATPVRALAATLDRELDAIAAGFVLPPLWHWLYFLPLHRQSDLGDDGHAKRGGFLPPIPLPRRMWAGSTFEFRSPIRVGDNVTRRSTIDDVTLKAGRTGRLAFVRVRHEIRCNGAVEPALVEYHDIVYRDRAGANDAESPPKPAPAGAAWRREIVPTDVLLFRYSALTFNGHRIHYDRAYATNVERYPGLVVHGPLIATLLLELLARERPGLELSGFAFRATRPTFDGQPFFVGGAPSAVPGELRLWASDHGGFLTMDAVATRR